MPSLLNIHPYRPSDYPLVVGRGYHAKAIASPAARLLIAHQDLAHGVALWYAPSAGKIALLSEVRLSHPLRRTMLYALCDAAAQQALTEGYTHAAFMVTDRTTLARLQHDFILSPQVEGVNPSDRSPACWSLTVELTDARQQLRPFLLQSSYYTPR